MFKFKLVKQTGEPSQSFELGNGEGFNSDKFQSVASILNNDTINCSNSGISTCPRTQEFFMKNVSWDYFTAGKQQGKNANYTIEQYPACTRL